MFLTAKKSNLPSFSPFRAVGKRSPPIDFDLISRSFDESVLRRLKPLMISNGSPPSISLSWIALAVDFLAATHAEAQAQISKIANGSSDDGSKSLYLDCSVKLLDICNSISSDLDRLRSRRLLMNFVIRLLQVSDDVEVPVPEKLQKASDSIVDWQKNTRDLDFPKRRGFENRDPEALIRDLAAAVAKIAPRGKASSAEKAVLRTIYAVGLITVFVGGVAVSALRGLPEIVNVRVPAEFLWSESVNGLQSLIFDGEGKIVLTELDEVATRASGLRDLIMGVITGDNLEVKKLPLMNAVKELDTSTCFLSEGLDRLSDGVNDMFRNVLCTRNAVLENFRVGPGDKHRK